MHAVVVVAIATAPSRHFVEIPTFGREEKGIIAVLPVPCFRYRER